MRNLSIINESEDIVTKDYADQKLPGRPITKYDYDHLSPAEKDADIVYFIIDDDQDALEFDEVPTAGSDNPVKSKGIKAALDAKQNALTFDQTPTAGSQNPVTSDGVKSAITCSGVNFIETGSLTASGDTSWHSYINSSLSFRADTKYIYMFGSVHGTLSGSMVVPLQVRNLLPNEPFIVPIYFNADNQGVVQVYSTSFIVTAKTKDFDFDYELIEIY